MKKLIPYIIMLILALPVGAGADTYYFSVSGSDAGAGTFASPYKTVVKANSIIAGLSNGEHRIAFKAGDTWDTDAEWGNTAPATGLNVIKSGTSDSTRLTICAYDGDGDFDITGSNRPILQGSMTYATRRPNNAYGEGCLIDLKVSSTVGVDYVTVEDIHTKNSYGRGVGIGKYSSYVNIDNCYMEAGHRQGIICARAENCNITNNTIWEMNNSTNLPADDRYAGDSDPSGAQIEITGVSEANVCVDNYIAFNHVYQGYNEGIGCYQGAKNTIVEYNNIHGMGKYHLYFGDSDSNIARYNLVYESLDSPDNGTERDYLVVINDEALAFNGTSNHEIYDNLIANGSRGIAILNNDSDVTISAKIYNNTVVDCRNTADTSGGNLMINANAGSFGTLDIQNNIFAVYVTGTQLVGGSTGSGTFGYNLWSSDPGGTPGDGTNIVGTPNLSKTTGWRDALSLDGTEFVLADDTGDADNAGVVLDSPYNIGLHPTGTDYAASPPAVATTSQGATPDIGAFVYGGGGAPPAESCDLWYDFTGTVDIGWALGIYATQEYAGMRWTQPSDQDVCKVDVYCRNINGTLGANHDYYMRVFTVDGNDDVDVVIGTSSKIDGSDLAVNTWTSANAGYWEFDPVISLTASTEYAFTIFPDQDGDQSDAPEIDGTNNWLWGIDNENNTAANQNGRWTYTHDAEIPYADNNSDAQDDFLIKIYTGSIPTSPTTLGTGSYVIATNTYTEGPTTTINTTTPVNLAYEVSEELSNIAYPEQSEAPVNKSDDSLIRNAVYYDHVQAVGGEWVVVYIYTPVAGDRDLDIKLGTVVKNDATMQDGDSNEWDGTGGDLGDIAVAMVKDANSPWEVKPSGGHATTILGLETAVDHLLSGDYVVAQSSAESYTATVAGVTYRVLSITDFDCGALDITCYGCLNRVSGSLTNSESATLYSYNPPRVTN